MFVQYVKPNYFAASLALLLGAALVCDLVIRGIACTTFEIARALASGPPTPVNAAIVAGEALKTVGGGVGAGGGAGGEGLGTGAAGGVVVGFGLLNTPASCKPATDFIICNSDS